MTLFVLIVLAQPLTADRAVDMAFAASPQLAAMQLEIQQARARAEGAGALPNPELRLSGLRSDRLLVAGFDEDAIYRNPLDGVSVGLRWQPPNPGVVKALQEGEDYRVLRIEARMAEERRRVEARVRERHGTLINLAARVKLRETAAELRAAIHALVLQRLAAQQTTALERNISELDQIDAEAELETLRNRLTEARHELLRTIGLPPNSEVGVERAKGWCPTPSVSLEKLTERALGMHPELIEFEARYAELRADHRRVEWERAPWVRFVELSFNFAEGVHPVRMTNDAECGAGCDDPAYLALRLGFTLPVFDLKGPELKQIRTEGTRVAVEQAAAKARVEFEVREAFEALRRAAALYARYAGATKVVDDTEERIRKSLVAGVADPVKAAVAQRRINSARRARLRAELSCHRAAIDLSRLVGPIE